MSLKTSDVSHSSNIHDTTTYSRDIRTLSPKSKCALVALAVGGVAGVVLLALGGIELFGAVGSVGFIATLAGGSVLFFISIGCIIWIAIGNCKSQKNTTTSTSNQNKTQSQSATTEKVNIKIYSEEGLVKEISQPVEQTISRNLGSLATSETIYANKFQNPYLEENQKSLYGEVFQHQKNEPGSTASTSHSSPESSDKSAPEPEIPQEPSLIPSASTQNPLAPKNVLPHADPQVPQQPSAVSSSIPKPHIIHPSSTPEIPKNSLSPSRSTVPQQPSSNAAREFNERQNHFRTVVKERMEKKPVSPFTLPDSQALGFEKDAQEACSHFFHTPPESTIKNFSGGLHVSVTTDKIPGVLFKQDRSLNNMDSYLLRTQAARKICNEHQLDLLYVPECKPIGPESRIIMEEKVELLDGGWESQRACFQWGINDPQLQPYFKELLRQLTVFICISGFANVNYKHVSLMKDGRLALISLNVNGAVSGLTRGLARGRDGLFNIIPLKWFDEFIDIAKNYLSAKDFEESNKALQALKQRAQKREERAIKKAEFYKTKNVTSPTQPLIFDEKLFVGYKPEVVLFVKKTIEQLNEKIAALSLLSMIVGRKIVIDIDKRDSFYKSIVNHPEFPQQSRHTQFPEVKQEALDALKEKGYILSYKNREYAFSVVC